MDMKVLLLALSGALAALAQAPAEAPSPAPSLPAPPTRLATIHVQSAILSSKLGQKAAQDLQTKFNQRRQDLEKRQARLAGLQQQMRAGAATMSAAARDKLTRDIDTEAKDFKRDSEDYDAEVRDEEGKLMADLGQKMMEVISKYAAANGIALLVDVSNPQSAILWADPSLDITTDIVKQFDQAHPLPAETQATPPPAPAKKLPEPGL